MYPLTLMLGFLVPHLAVNINPCNAIKKNWENVIKFPMPGSSLTKSSKKTTLLIHPKNVDPIATGTLILQKYIKTFQSFAQTNDINLNTKLLNLITQTYYPLVDTIAQVKINKNQANQN